MSITPITPTVGMLSPLSAGSDPVSSPIANVWSNFFRGACQPKGPSPISFSAGVIDVENTVADISCFFRTLGPLIGADQTLAYDAFGITTGENFLVGLSGLQGAWGQFIKAGGIGSDVGKSTALRKMLGSFLQTVGGAAYLGLRPITIANQILNNAPNSALGMAATQLANVGNGAFACFWIALVCLGAHGISHQNPFLKEMKSLEEDSSGLAAFLFPEPRQDLVNTINGLNANSKELNLFKQKLGETARGSMVYQFLFQMMKEAQRQLQKETPTNKPLSDNEIDKKIATLLGEDPQIAENVKKIGLENATNKLGLNPLESFGLSIEAKNSDQRRVTKLNVNGADVLLIEKAINRGLDRRINDENQIIKVAAEKELKTLVSTLKEGVEKSRNLNWLLIVIAVLGVITTIAGFIACPPLLAFIVGGLTVFFVGLMYGADWYFGAKEALVAKVAPGKHDKRFIYVSTAILLAGLITSAGLTFGLSLAIPAFIVSMTAGGISLGHLFWSYKKITKREREWTENHLTLEQCQAALTADKTEGAALRFFKKLSKQDRGAIREKINANCEPHSMCFELFTGIDKGMRIKAAKKSAKVFWATHRDSKLAADLANARAMQLILEQLKEDTHYEITSELEDLLKGQDIQGFDLLKLQDEIRKNLMYLGKKCQKEELLSHIDSLILSNAAQETEKKAAMEFLKVALKSPDALIESNAAQAAEKKAALESSAIPAGLQAANSEPVKDARFVDFKPVSLPGPLALSVQPVNKAPMGAPDGVSTPLHKEPEGIALASLGVALKSPDAPIETQPFSWILDWFQNTNLGSEIDLVGVPLFPSLKSHAFATWDNEVD